MKLGKREVLARSRLCLPLDGIVDLEGLRQRVEELSPFVGLFKIGKETFTRFGPESVRIVRGYGSDVFLDLKFHDIPNTVKGASAAAAELGVSLFNVHASGGLEMMKAAKEGAASTGKAPKILGVTVLTSIDDNILNNELRIKGTVASHVLDLALLSAKAGLDGIVCSAQDLHEIRDKLPKDFLFVTPGIKAPGSVAGSDQKRVFTPGNAIKDGASILVAGRTITDHKTREERINAAIAILKDMAGSGIFK